MRKVNVLSIKFLKNNFFLVCKIVTKIIKIIVKKYNEKKIEK